MAVPLKRRSFPVERAARRAFPPVLQCASVLVRRPFPSAVEPYRAPEFFDSVFHRWARSYIRRNMWRALPQDDPDDLLQDAYLKYHRCVELYVDQRDTCKSHKHLMCLFKQSLVNMLTDRSRKKLRRPGAYYYEEVNDEHLLDRTLLAIEEIAHFPQRENKSCH